ncbi:ATPase, T2SS/T4P/T4SS family [Exiguobacterium antarcticum]|uniref:ATPase, T2SS/T4P/T4SS family n=1 Tax=Exiguobacterium antarcticum TaxID=132920 RepID=UPI000285E67F|nr:ATPase, T2SS/T4P/T4SS family [Exiguobacterium antarcticum]AFS69993.1 Type II secretion system protein E [Exiguobacterium antarcticum B7]
MREEISQLIRQFEVVGATDVHFIPGDRLAQIICRTSEGLAEQSPIAVEHYRALVSHIRYESNLKEQNERIPQSGLYPFQESGMRVSILPSRYGDAMSWRFYRAVVSSEIAVRLLDPTLDLEWMKQQTHGCIIISGTTGAGKTTMLYSLMASMEGKRIISVEDPVECTVPGILQLELNDKAGFDATRCFEEILRADPDWIAFGEVRTAEAARLTINAALSGHVVLFTLHAGSIEEALLRLKTLGITGEELSVCKKIVHLYREEGTVRCIVENLQSAVNAGS